jgi:hypothetical protein
LSHLPMSGDLSTTAKSQIKKLANAEMTAMSDTEVCEAALSSSSSPSEVSSPEATDASPPVDILLQTEIPRFQAAPASSKPPPETLYAKSGEDTASLNCARDVVLTW